MQLCQATRPITKFGTLTLFKDAQVYTALLFLSRSNNIKIQYSKLESSDALDVMLNSIKQNAGTGKGYFIRHISLQELVSEDWRVSPPDDAEIISIISMSSIQLKNIADCFRGIETGKDALFIVELIRTEGDLAFVKSKVKPDGFWIESAILKKLVRTRNFQPYCSIQPLEMVIYPHWMPEKNLNESQFKDTYPLAFEYVQANYPMLAGKPESRWFGLNNPGDIKLLNSPKLITSVGGNVQIDENGDVMFLGASLRCGIVPTQSDISIYAILGLINSSVIKKYMEVKAVSLGSAPVYSVSNMDALPIPDYNAQTASLYTELDALVRHIVEQKKANPNADTAALEAKVDQLVERLYRVAAEAARNAA